MKNIYFSIIFIFLGLQPFQVFSQETITDELLIQFENWTVNEEQIVLSESANEFLTWQIISKELKIAKAIFDETKYSQEALIELIAKEPNVISISPNRISEYRNEPNPPNDSLYFEQWDMEIIEANLAWSIATGGLTIQGDTIVVAVIDEGVDYEHEDLKNNLWFNYEEIPNDGIDNDNNGFIDDYRGWSFKFGNDNHPIVQHGTASVGIVGAIGNNDKGVTGVNWTVKVMVLSQALSEADLIEAYDYVLQMRKKYNETNGASGAFVVATTIAQGFNLGQPASFPMLCAMYDALGEQGILNAAATANASINVDIQGDVPSGCTSDYLISVTNSDRNDELRSTAAFGEKSIDLSAPGSGTYTTTINNLYNRAAGTSAATPHVSGTIGLLYNYQNEAFINFVKTQPSAAALLLKSAILNGTDPLSSLEGKTVTGGRLNVLNSFLLLEKYTEGYNDSLLIISTFPSPAQDDLFIKYDAPGDDFEIFIFNELGQQVRLGTVSTELVSTKTLHLNIASLQNGMYFLVLQNANQKLVQRFMVLK
jgi:subtilisin family serine protease